jgi:YVTN family beta-propeller protein
MQNRDLRRSRIGRRGLWFALFAAAEFMLGTSQCNRMRDSNFKTGHPLFASPQFNPVAVSPDGPFVYVANTTSGTVSVIDTHRPSHPFEIAQIPVGLDPVGLAVRPKLGRGEPDEDEFVFVANHISDSVSVISVRKLAVVQTLQGLAHADGGATPDDLVTTTDEPVGIAFQDPCRAFVTLGQPNQVIVLEMADPQHTGICDERRGEWSISPTRLAITAQAPRALAVSGNKLYVAAFESGNQTQFPSCAPGDPRGFTPGDPFDEGCLFQMRIIDSVGLDAQGQFSLNLGTIFRFAARDPNIGGQVILNRNIPDRDLFVYDLTAPGFDSDPNAPGIQPAQVVSGVGTLLYGVAVGANSRVYVTNTDARNQLNGLRLLGNRMFDNRISYLDCAGACGAPVAVDLDASATTALGTTAPTPYGLAVSQDGAILVVTAAGSDGTQGFPGLYTLDASGHVLGGVRTGAIPQGVALRSNRKTGAADLAFVLNTVDSTLSVVNVEEPSTPSVMATIEVGNDPTPPAVKRGRIIFSSARASTSGTFSCESCHPNGNIDQLLWTINAFESPTDPPGIQPPEPRTTMPIRGLRDTLPLHWEGRLADFYPNPPADPARPNLVPGKTQDCNLETDGEIGCIRTLVNASLSGVMCAQPDCPAGPSGLPGAFSDAERTDIATFLQAVSFPPAPERRPSDRLSQTANLGVQDFFTDSGLGIGHGIGNTQQIGFGVITCADNAIGCHSLPLTVGTNSSIVGRFDAPSARGLWDRHILFSDGLMSSYEFLQFAQDCANGIEPPNNPHVFRALTGDPCDLHSPLGIPLAKLPFPSHAHIYDPAEGITERGQFLATFEGIFSLAYGVRGERIWQFQVEMGTGLPGLTGRQVSVTRSSVSDPDTIAQIQQLEQAATEGKIVAMVRAPELQELRFDSASQTWKNHSGRFAMTSAQIREDAQEGERVYTFTAELPSEITGGGPDRQPLLDIDPDLKAAEIAAGFGQAPHIPQPAPGVAATFRVGVKYVESGAQVLVDGTLCGGCRLQFTTAQNGDPAADVTLAEGLTAGMHVIQVHNPDGWVSNELPVLAK